MEKSLIIRVGLVCAVVVLYLIASQAGFYPKASGPVAVIAVAAIMFWPKDTGRDRGPSRSEMLRDIRSEQDM